MIVITAIGSFVRVPYRFKNFSQQYDTQSYDNSCCCYASFFNNGLISPSPSVRRARTRDDERAMCPRRVGGESETNPTGEERRWSFPRDDEAVQDAFAALTRVAHVHPSI